MIDVRKKDKHAAARHRAARRRKPEEQENNDRWLVSYADFITLLFAFFVMMYALSTIDTGKYRMMSESMASAFNPMPIGGAALPKQPITTNSQNGTLLLKDLQKSLAALIQRDQVQVAQNDRGVAISINASLLFPAGSSALNPSAADTLAFIAKTLATDSRQLQIEGYTDDIPINSPQFPSNWELSSARASAVVRLFHANGVATERLVAVGYGENRPQDTNATPEGRARNRRVAVQILTDNAGPTSAGAGPAK